MAALGEMAGGYGIPMIIQGPGTFFGAVFGQEPLVDFRSTFSLNQERARQFSEEMLLRGVYCFPKGRGLWYLSAAHADSDIDETLEIADQVMAHLS